MPRDLRKRIPALRKSSKLILRLLWKALIASKLTDDLMPHPSQELRRSRQRKRPYMVFEQFTNNDLTKGEVNSALDELFQHGLIESNYTQEGEEHYWLSPDGVVHCDAAQNPQKNSTTLQFENLTLDPSTRQFFYKGIPIKGIGSGKAYKILKELLRTKQLLLFPVLAEIIGLKRGTDFQKCEANVREAVKQLKRALKGAGCPLIIQNRFGQGYFLATATRRSTL
jgi:DNA-binding response OmpR family regulator